MQSRDSYVMGCLAAVLVAAWSLVAAAQDSTDADKVRAAGGEAHFRVITRFPDASPSAQPAVKLEDFPSVDPAIRAAIAARQFGVAHLLVDKMKADDSYLKLLDGYLAMRAGKFEHALSALEAVGGGVSRLEDYRAYWAAKSAFKLDNYHLAALRAAKVATDSPVLGRSLMLLADSLVHAGTDSDLERAVETLRLYLAKYPHGRSAEDARLGLGRALEKRAVKHRADSQKSTDPDSDVADSDWKAAARAYLEVIEKHGASASAKEAHRRLTVIKSHLSDAAKKAIDHPSVDAKLNRFRGLFASHKSKKVIAELPGELAGLKRHQARRCEALYMIAKSHTKLRQHTAGAKWYKRILGECSDTKYALKALYLGGKGRWNAGKLASAKKWFERIWTAHANHSYADDAMYFAARIDRDQNKSAAAKKMLQKQVSRYPDGDMAKDAHWLLVRQMFDDSDYKRVVAYVDGLQNTGEDDIYSRGRLHYFRARALEKLHETAAARQGYKAVARQNPLSYYAYLAFSRLGRMAGGWPGGAGKPSGNSAGAADVCSLDSGNLCNFVRPSRSPAISVPDDLKTDRRFKRGAVLLQLGLTGLADTEFQRLRLARGGDKNLWALVYLLDLADAPHISHDLARRHIDGWKTHYPKDGDDPRWSLAYPMPYRQLVDKYVRQRNLPRALIYAIMREESGFNPRAESWANARGLLQLMESTAKGVAKKDGLKGFRADNLLEPATSIRLGTAYIAQLSAHLAAHPALIIAGYNGGRTNVSRWLDKRGNLPLDLWVEDIPYGQTRKYTKRVLSSFWTYSWMYAPQRVPPLPFNLPTK